MARCSRFLVRMEDSTVILVADSQEQWARNEALACIDQLIICDVQASHLQLQQLELSNPSWLDSVRWASLSVLVCSFFFYSTVSPAVSYLWWYQFLV